MRFLFAAILGALFGGAAVFFASGGLVKHKLFFRLLRRKGKWKKVWAIMLCISALEGIYACWLFDGIGRSFFSMMLLCCYLLSMSATDLRGRYLPNDAALFFGIVFTAFQVSTLDVATVINSLIGCGVGLALLGLPHLIRPKEVGLGDVKLMAVCGILVGFPGIVYLLVRGLVFIALFSIVKLIRKKANLKTQLPLVPFLFIGAHI